MSLAAALALPLGFPERDLLVFLAFCVILVTLVGQGLTLAPLIRALHIEPDDDVAREEEEARRTATQAALDELDRLRGDWPTHLPLLDRLVVAFRHRLEHLPEDGEASEGGAGASGTSGHPGARDQRAARGGRRDARAGAYRRWRAAGHGARAGP
ncbi:MAG: hypothetical protein R3C32_01350 [Chloroflexota bacterium]